MDNSPIEVSIVIKPLQSDQINEFVSDLHSDGWNVIDLAEALLEAGQSRDATLGCDGHWNATTNRKIAEFNLVHYREYLTGVPAQAIQ